MGYYINPPDMGKIEWLKHNGILTDIPAMPEKGKSLICLVDNGLFTAAGICFSQRELEAFADPSDDRLKCWFIVDTDRLYGVSNLPRNLGA